MYKNTICFSFPFIERERETETERERERQRERERETERERERDRERERQRQRQRERERTVLAHTHKLTFMDLLWTNFSSFFTFMRLVKSSIKASNHLSFSLLHYFSKSLTGPSQAPLLWAVWHKARSQRGMTSSSCLWPVFFLVTASYIIFWMPMQILVVTPLVCYLNIACDHAYPCNLCITSSGRGEENLRPVF